ncbi:MAG: Xaa-Pro aminopeptidase [Myxococcales bacterium]|nr:Xaa-Pro aminopeptidase [Myxococcales bacterium]
MPTDHGRRRAAVLDAMRAASPAGAVAVFPSTPTAIRNNDVEHDYRQDSDLYYLTGFDEPSSVLLLSTAHGDHGSVLFLRERDPDREVWDGPRLGTERAPEALGIDAAFPIGELAKQLPGYLAGARRLYYALARDSDFDRGIFRAVAALEPRQRREGVRVPVEFVDPSVIVHEMRLFKDSSEVALMRKAAEITAEAHRRAMEVARPGRFEYEVEAEILRVFRAHGCERSAYGSIVGSGPNATVLHHRRNDRKMEKGDLLLIDAGAEYGYYASDVTRTFPVDGTFTEPQRLLYDVVLRAQKAAMEATRPGATMGDVHRAAAEVTVDGLSSLGLLAGSREEILERESYKAFFMHKTSHYLGMDVHDVGSYFVAEGKQRPLEPGMVITVEPGIYVAPGAEVDSKWHGIGIRIEDDLLVTESGNDVLTASIPKDPQEIESILAARST